jgi:hypothetical protein
LATMTTHSMPSSRFIGGTADNVLIPHPASRSSRKPERAVVFVDNWMPGLSERSSAINPGGSSALPGKLSSAQSRMDLNKECVEIKPTEVMEDVWKPNWAYSVCSDFGRLTIVMFGILLPPRNLHQKQGRHETVWIGL